MAALSPCTGVCQLDADANRCLGCGRTIAEIQAWPDLNDTERRRIMDALALAKETKQKEALLF